MSRSTVSWVWTVALSLLLGGSLRAGDESPSRRNVLVILVDDQRWDAMSCEGHPFLETPAVDSLATGGVRFRRAYVTTSLCSPSRATILTGLYAHSHSVVDNRTELPTELITFNEHLGKVGYRTAFIGKWHMGYGSDAPRRGWDHWVSFLGQGHYFPELKNGRIAQLNVNGQRVPQTKYITDELTDHALAWLRSRASKDEPWLLYLSHKAVHSDFLPAPRHRGKYADVELESFPSSQGTPADAKKPMWARNQRNSWHGAEFPYHGQLGKTADLYRRYCETLLSVDESTQRLLDHLRESGQLDSTLVVYLGDNGHLWGEQGLIDKRTAYETSIRVPLLMHCPELLPAGGVVDELVATIDISPTILEAAGLKKWQELPVRHEVAAPGHGASPSRLPGRSLLPLARGEKIENWRQDLLYEYFWERWAPSTPTLHALVTPRWKYVRAYGVWDVPELYDLKADPHELVNLFHDPRHHERAIALDERLFELLEETDGHDIPLRRGWKGRAKELRDPGQSGWSEFPEVLKAGPKES